jgi:cytochrome c-type biogenesis protein CcmH
MVLLCALLAAPGYAAEAVVQEDPIEREMLEIAKDLRCAVCQSQAVSESNADLARDMRDIIREQLKAGKSPEEIKQYFVERYGDYVLMKPPVRGAGRGVWLAPLLILALTASGAFVYLRNRRHPLPPVAELSAEDLARVRAAEADADINLSDNNKNRNAN